jgi:hypothetical protein
MLLCISPLLCAPVAHGQVAYTDSQGRQWREITPTVARSWNQVAAVCPTDGVTPCNGALGSTSVTGWVWATREDVIELLSEWVPAIAKTGEAGGAQYTPQGLGFFEVFNETSFSCTVVGCSFGVSGWTSTLVPGSTTSAYTASVGAGYNPNYGWFTANFAAPVTEIYSTRGVWMYLPAPAPSCPADLNDDGSVGPADLATLLNAWGTTGAADLDGNGVVDAPDLAAMLSAWGDC